jgi:hypothetical protein
MQRQSIKYVAMVAALALGGCDLLPAFLGRPTGSVPPEIGDRSATPAPA